MPLEALIGAPERLEAVATFIVDHWEKRRAAMEGKAMVVTMSRDIAARLYDEIKTLRPQWHDPDDDEGRDEGRDDRRDRTINGAIAKAMCAPRRHAKARSRSGSRTPPTTSAW